MLTKVSFTFFIFCLSIAIICLAPSFYAAAQTPGIITIEPETGPPGSTVGIRDASGTNAGKTCVVTVGDAPPESIGVMQGAVRYIVPLSAAPGTVFEFLCVGGVDGLRTISVQFTVTGSDTAPSDTDGDGSGDTRDNCPNEAGPPENQGCPVPQPDPDSDGDGLADPADACPNETGPSENNGCPVTAPDADGDGDGIPDSADACPTQPGPAEQNGCAPSPLPPSPVPDIVLPSLPTDGPCVVATLDVTSVNVRQEPSTDSSIVAVLDPLQTYPVLARTDAGDWFQIDSGWVAQWVTRQGGNCAAVSPASQPADIVLPAPDVPPALKPIVPPLLVVGERMQGCPELAAEVATLPTFVQLYVAGAPDACASAEVELADLFFNADQLTTYADPIPDAPYGDCNLPGYDFEAAIVHFIPFMQRLEHYAPATWEVVSDLMDLDDPCWFIYDLMIFEKVPPELPDEHVAPFVTAYCMTGSMTPSWFTKTAGFVDFLGVQRTAIEDLQGAEGAGNDTCGFISILRTVGTVYTANAELFQFAYTICLRHPEQAAKVAFLEAIRQGLNAEAGLVNCGTVDFLGDYPLPDDLLPLLPSVAESEFCREMFRLLATHNQVLGMEMLYRMLTAPDPCGLAWEFSRDGSVLEISGQEAPDCIQGDELVLTGTANQTTVLNKQSSWRDKITILDRPFDQVCEWITLPGEGDSFAAEPTTISASDDVAIAPSATPLGFAVAPSPTPPQVILVTTPAGDIPPEEPNGEPDPEVPPEEPDGEPDPEVPPEDEPVPDIPPIDFVTVDPPTGVQPTGESPLVAPLATQIPTQPGADSANDTLLPPGMSTVFLPGVDTPEAIAMFLGTNTDGSFEGVYVLTGVQHSADGTAFRRYYLEDAWPAEEAPLGFTGSAQPVSLAPNGESIAFFGAMPSADELPAASHTTIVQSSLAESNPQASPDATGDTVLHLGRMVLDEDAQGDGTILLEGHRVLVFQLGGLTISPQFAPLWLPDNSGLLLTLLDEAGTPSIYAIDLSVQEEQLVLRPVLENASVPAVSPNGRYLAFERDESGGRNIYVMATNSGEIHAVTNQPDGSECFGPTFGSGSLTLFFTCQAGDARRMFRYGITGVSELEVGIENAGNPAPGPGPGFIAFDDGTSIYLSRDDGTQVIPLLQVDGVNSSHLIWSLIEPPQNDSELRPKLIDLWSLGS